MKRENVHPNLPFFLTKIQNSQNTKRKTMNSCVRKRKKFRQKENPNAEFREKLENFLLYISFVAFA